MKRHVGLQDISREHQHTLSLAQQIIRAVQANDLNVMDSLTKKAHTFYHQELKPHFQQEEDSFFRILSQEYPEHQPLVANYLAEHKMLSDMAVQLGSASTSHQLLEDFALLLKSHTRKEERELFPMIEFCFTESQLRTIPIGNVE